MLLKHILTVWRFNCRHQDVKSPPGRFLCVTPQIDGDDAAVCWSRTGRKVPICSVGESADRVPAGQRAESGDRNRRYVLLISSSICTCSQQVQMELELPHFVSIPSSSSSRLHVWASATLQELHTPRGALLHLAGAERFDGRPPCSSEEEEEGGGRRVVGR